MPVPSEYQYATVDFYRFLSDARDQADFTTMNQAYTMVQAFRRWLDVRDAIRFASVLPVGLRALFIADWDINEARRPFEDRAAMTGEAQSPRPLHNYAPDGYRPRCGCIET